jgi:hypothetical protein
MSSFCLGGEDKELLECACILHRACGPTNADDEPYMFTCACACKVHVHAHKGVCPHIEAEDFTHPNLSPISYSFSTHFGSGAMMGIEIEVEVSDKARALDAWSDSGLTSLYIVKLEVSVPGGLEFVSAPMSLAYHVRALRQLYVWFDRLRQDGVDVKSSTRTGTHVHMQKTAVSSDNLKWLTRYICEHATEVDAFAGRPGNKFCERVCYIGLNKTTALRETPHTVEVRIFKTFEDCDSVIQRLAVLNRMICTAP